MTKSIITTSIFAVTTNLNMGNGYIFPIAQAFFESKKSAKKFLKVTPFKGEIKKLDPTDYTFTVQRNSDEIPLVALNGSRFYADVENSQNEYKALFPDDCVQVMKYDETELYRLLVIESRDYHENKGVMYA